MIVGNTISLIFKFKPFVLDNDYLNSHLFVKSIFSYEVHVDGSSEITPLS